MPLLHPIHKVLLVLREATVEAPLLLHRGDAAAFGVAARAHDGIARKRKDLLVHAAVELPGIPLISLAAAADQQRIPGEGKGRRARAQHIGHAPRGVAGCLPHFQLQQAQVDALAVAYLHIGIRTGGLRDDGAQPRLRLPQEAARGAILRVGVRVQHILQAESHASQQGQVPVHLPLHGIDEQGLQGHLASDDVRQPGGVVVIELNHFRAASDQRLHLAHLGQLILQPLLCFRPYSVELQVMQQLVHRSLAVAVPKRHPKQQRDCGAVRAAALDHQRSWHLGNGGKHLVHRTYGTILAGFEGHQFQI